MQGSILSRALMSYAPMIDRGRAVVSTRLTVQPIDPTHSLDVTEVIALLDQAWPADATSVTLDVGGDVLTPKMLDTVFTAPVMLEIPVTRANDPANTEAILKLHGRGVRLILNGVPQAQPLPQPLLPCFKQSIIPLELDRRVNQEGAAAPTGMHRSIGFVQSGVRTIAEMEASFGRAAQAIVGWPFDDALKTHARQGANPDLNTIVELIRQVEKGEDPSKIETIIRRDPSLAYRLLRYINSPAFGLAIEIQSFKHAVMMLGYTRLKRWLALLLATGSKEANLRPVMYASVRRGMFLEHLVGAEHDENLRDELFICGVFSLLDKLFQTPFEELFATLNVPENVYDALVQGSGPYKPYLDIVQMLESGVDTKLIELAEMSVISIEQINRALLHALGSAARLGG
jgi:EAL and modified HD-GYP domain-containing signal transduction protein